MILSLSFAVLKHQLSLLLFILPGQGNITKVFAIWSFPNSCYIQPELRTILLNFLKHCCSASWVRVTLVQQMPRILGCHLILRNIKSIIMFHLLWDIYLCFDQITKNIWNTKTHICGGKTWGREIINAPWGHWWFLSLYGCCRDRDVWWWNVGFPNHLALDWLWAKRTLWIRHIPQSTRIIVPSRTSRTRSHSLKGCSLYSFAIFIYT